jgi:hypothetical protein
VAPAELADLIAGGEGARVEFKSSLGLGLTKEKRERTYRECAQAVAAFMNSDGGTLVIGVRDNGDVIGVECDSRSGAGAMPFSSDQYEQRLRSVLSNLLGAVAAASVRVCFVGHGAATVAVVKCNARHTDVYVRDGNKNRFFIRSGNTTRELDAKETLEYLAQRQLPGPVQAPPGGGEVESWQTVQVPSVLYLQWLVPLRGQARDALIGRALFDLLQKRLAREIRLASVVQEDPGLLPLDPEVGDFVLAAEDVAASAPDVIFVEGGLLLGGDQWRIPADLALELVTAGTVLIVADVNANKCAEAPQQYREALRFLGGVEPDLDRDRNDAPADLVDFHSHGTSATSLVIRPSSMAFLSEWLRPVYEDVDSILASNAVRLLRPVEGIASALATGNATTTRVMRLDLPIADGRPSLFATVTPVRLGFVVVIAANVTADVLLRRSPANGTWLMNIARFLYAEVVAERSRRQASIRSKPFDEGSETGSL